MFCPRRAPLNPGRAPASSPLTHHQRHSRAAGSCFDQVRSFPSTPSTSGFAKSGRSRWPKRTIGNPNVLAADGLQKGVEQPLHFCVRRCALILGAQQSAERRNIEIEDQLADIAQRAVRGGPCT
jgi:hypothetical protein